MSRIVEAVLNRFCSLPKDNILELFDANVLLQLRNNNDPVHGILVLIA